ncbi:YitT family protein [Globicatella sanguinis]
MKRINDYLKMETSTIIFSIVMITLGCAIYAVGINSFVLPNKFASGGVSGIAIILYYMRQINVGATNFILNAILLLIGWKFIEKRTLVFTIYALAMMSWFMEIIQTPSFTSENVLISSIAGGVVMGIGMGIIVRGNGTTAGTDIIALMLKKFFGLGFSLGVFLINLLIIIASSFVIGLENAIVTLIMKFIASYMIDVFTEGLDRRKSLMIISEKQDEVAHAIIEQVGRGLTVLKAYGYYSHREKDVLYVIVSRHQVIQIQRLISKIDAKAFVTISDVQQVIGQGFTFYDAGNRNKRFYSDNANY